MISLKTPRWIYRRLDLLLNKCAELDFASVVSHMSQLYNEAISQRWNSIGKDILCHSRIDPELEEESIFCSR
jgi:hypothetical protein